MIEAGTHLKPLYGVTYPLAELRTKALCTSGFKIEGVEGENNYISEVIKLHTHQNKQKRKSKQQIESFRKL